MSELARTRVAAELAGWLGDPHPLTEQIGSASGLEALPLSTSLSARSVRDAASLRTFLHAYRDEVLVPVELPAIIRAHSHAAQGGARELIALDEALSREPRLQNFGAASKAVGRAQLHRLLPMRDQRLVRRYWQACESGHAQAWHVVVYGLVLAVFSFPLRQGLASYGEQTLAGFVAAARRPVGLGESGCLDLLAAAVQPLPGAVNSLLQPRSELKLLAC